MFRPNIRHLCRGFHGVIPWRGRFLGRFWDFLNSKPSAWFAVDHAEGCFVGLSAAESAPTSYFSRNYPSWPKSGQAVGMLSAFTPPGTTSEGCISTEAAVMNWIHALMVAASAAEMYSESGTYVMAMVQCAACLSQFVLRNWIRCVDG